MSRGYDASVSPPPPPPPFSRRYDIGPLRNRRPAVYPIPNGPTPAAAPPTGRSARRQRRNVSQCPKMSHLRRNRLPPHS